MNEMEARKQIDNFEDHYKYDCTYMRELLESSAEGFARFSNFLPLSGHREKLTAEEYWVAKLAAMQVEDCGDCLQLNVHMALEAGVSRHIVQATINGGDALPENLQDIYNYASAVAAHDQVDTALMQRIETQYDKGRILEFGLCIATAKVFPTVKRALGYTKSCSRVKIEM